MPITIKNKPGGQIPPSDNTLIVLQQKVREALNLGSHVQVRLGYTETTLMDGGVKATLPFGIADVKNQSTSLMSTYKRLQDLSGGGTPLSAVNPAQEGAQSLSYSDMTDDLWVEHVAKSLFPGVVHLFKVDELYQPVIGTSGGSIYKSCFIGPDLKVAARIKNNSVSFRATTSSDTCPEGTVRETLGRLGIDNVYENRMTGHVSMGGPYDDTFAHEYRALFGAMYAALKPWITSNFPAIGKLTQGVK